ncbi:MAG: hypothetical protein HW416_1026 [Chloroflexi bacterium]|nr:hypothetical protein [Chloroflexota bacterium]
MAAFAGCTANVGCEAFDPTVGRAGEWRQFAQIDVTSGMILVEDLSFIPKAEDALILELPSGTYVVEHKPVAFGCDVRTGRLRATLNGSGGLFGRELGSTWTDTAMTAVTDYVSAEAALQRAGKASFYERIEAAASRSITGRGETVMLDDVIGPMVAFVSSGFGDGAYPVYELTSNGNRVGIEIEFIKAGEQYPFTPGRYRTP